MKKVHNFIDLTGEVKSTVTVLEKSWSDGITRFWKCTCLCGASFEVAGAKFRTSPHCCPECDGERYQEGLKKYPVGMIQGSIKVRGIVSKKPVVFRCSCACGKWVNVPLYELDRGRACCARDCRVGQRLKGRKLSSCKGNKHLFRGEELTFLELLKRCGGRRSIKVTAHNFRQRIRYGWSVEEALGLVYRNQQGRKPTHSFILFGEKVHPMEISRSFGIPYGRLYTWVFGSKSGKGAPLPQEEIERLILLYAARKKSAPSKKA